MKHSSQPKQCTFCTKPIQENFKDESPIILFIFAVTVIAYYIVLKRRREQLPVLMPALIPVRSNENVSAKEASPQQTQRIKYLEREIEEQNISEQNLHQDVEKLNNEIMALRKNYNAETEELRNAYNELKEEASQVIAWLQKQVADSDNNNNNNNQSRDEHGAVEIEIAGDGNGNEEDSDLDSLTHSEREQLSMEIEEERKHWIGDLGVGAGAGDTPSPDRVDITVPDVKRELSTDGVTLANLVSP